LALKQLLIRRCTAGENVNALNQSERSQLRSSEQLIAAVGRIEDAIRGQDGTLKQLMGSIDRLKKSL
jgi:hypothetical protein